MAKWLIMNCVKLDMFGMQNSAVFCFFFLFAFPHVVRTVEACNGLSFTINQALF